MAADPDTVRDVIHDFNARGLATLDPRRAGGRPRLISRDDEAFVVAAAKARPTWAGLPFTRWSLRTLAAHLHRNPDRRVRIGRERLRQILHRHGVTFQRTGIWKTSNDPTFDAKLDRIDEVLTRFPNRCFAFDQFGPLSIRPHHGADTCAGATPTHATPTSSPRNAANGPLSAANATNAGADHNLKRPDQPGKGSWSAHQVVSGKPVIGASDSSCSLLAPTRTARTCRVPHVRRRTNRCSHFQPVADAAGR
ncbi:helix-turn-helix domain-containing protein [Actinosynnema sp. NPDC059335]|uniref:helix-turn-helix domain-containing protein n=1 Tax=Actinosynnema sp. NPDC059335 TaxID=3346804 RepID=UPI00366E7D1D